MADESEIKRGLDGVIVDASAVSKVMPEINALTALRALTLSSRGPCDAPPSRRTTLLAEEPARPSDVSPFYESKY